ncbi:hypothetical protein PVT67_15085 [Gallaecimonas kandeliae]|nr:hypothetical protein [Gallaecimonas kandeliae]WKE64971.1 hypothetical protein PVT67_15085 [Gallaecimonas kandeliae]
MPGTDPADMANCVDGLVPVDVQALKPQKRGRYIDAHKAGEQ